MDDDPDLEKDAVAAEGEQDPLDGESAEEAAVRVEPEDRAPGLTDGDDGYVDES